MACSNIRNLYMYKLKEHWDMLESEPNLHPSLRKQLLISGLLSSGLREFYVEVYSEILKIKTGF